LEKEGEKISPFFKGGLRGIEKGIFHLTKIKNRV
jgi:hypothetical protein